MGVGSAYERELRSVLAGEEKGVRAITRSCSESERAQAMQICQRPFLVVRAPGSGSEGTGDLLLLRGDICFPIEVKSSKKKQIISFRKNCLAISSSRRNRKKMFNTTILCIQIERSKRR